MKKNLIIMLFAFLMCFAFACQQAEEAVEEPAQDVKADVEAIKSLIEETSRTWNENDFEGYMALLDNEAVFLLDSGPTLEGIEALRSLYTNSFNLNTFNLEITTAEIYVWGNTAFSRDSWKGSMNPKDGSEQVIFDNKTITLYKRQTDGAWKIWRCIYNSNLPPDAE
jgi:uncharacterized protein (TIGR02246 family)